MLMDKPFNSQVSEKAGVLSTTTDTHLKGKNFLMTKKTNP